MQRRCAQLAKTHNGKGEGTPRKLATATALPFPQFALLHLVTCAELRLITILGNCGCVAVASFLGVPSTKEAAVVACFKFLSPY
jgi:hypothetical protein